MKSLKHRFEIILEAAEEGGYIVYCPALPGLVTQGETIEEAIEMGKEAIEGYVELLQKKNMPVPGEPVRRSRVIRKHVNIELENA